LINFHCCIDILFTCRQDCGDQEGRERESQTKDKREEELPILTELWASGKYLVGE
jgi:hypothetical protein